MKRTAKRLAAALLALLLVFALTACGAAAPAPTAPPASEPAPAATPEAVPTAEPSAPEREETPDDAPQPALPDEDGFYYDVENVVKYLAAYGRLPANYITKNEARALGWEGGTPEAYLEGTAIGGDRFGNREGLLPAAEGRSYTECDIDTLGKSSRGAKRLVFSNDGLYFYTEDHYESFCELLVTEEGDVLWN